MKNNDKIIELETAGITADYFLIPGHRYIFMAIIYLHSKQIKPTSVAILEVLSNEKAKKAVGELGGIEYLDILDSSFIPSDSFSIFIEKVKQSYTRKNLIDISKRIIELAQSEKAEVLNPTELITFAEEQINDLNVSISVKDDAYKMGEETESILSERIKRPNEVPGIEVGWEAYDKLTNGALGGDLIVVCAPSKVGKSALITNWACNLSTQSEMPILYIDTEMNAREQEDRLLSIISGVPHKEIVSGMYVLDTANGKSKEKIEKVQYAAELLRKNKYYHIYMPYFNIEQVSAISKKYALQHDIQALFFDYIKTPSNSNMGKNTQEYQQLGHFTSGLKDLAGTLDIPIFTACQTNRDNLGTQAPDASNIGGSYRILQLATKLMFLVNKSDEQIAKHGSQGGNQQLIIKYQRNGASDCDPINIMFQKEILRQSEV